MDTQIAFALAPALVLDVCALCAAVYILWLRFVRTNTLQRRKEAVLNPMAFAVLAGSASPMIFLRAISPLRFVPYVGVITVLVLLLLQPLEYIVACYFWYRSSAGPRRRIPVFLVVLVIPYAMVMLLPIYLTSDKPLPLAGPGLAAVLIGLFFALLEPGARATGVAGRIVVTSIGFLTERYVYKFVTAENRDSSVISYAILLTSFTKYALDVVQCIYTLQTLIKHNQAWKWKVFSSPCVPIIFLGFAELVYQLAQNRDISVKVILYFLLSLFEHITFSGTLGVLLALVYLYLSDKPKLESELVESKSERRGVPNKKQRGKR